jgi:tetratricopeptide (TPR) repeat protein
MSKGTNIHELRAAAEREPESIAARLRLGTALAQRNQLPEAREVLEQALQLDPRCAGAWVNLGGVCLTALDFQGCVDANQKAIECDPELALAHYNCGLGYLYLNQPEALLACMERVVDIEPQNGAGQYHLAVALHAVGRTAEAHQRLALATDIGHSPDPRFVKSIQKALQHLGGDGAAKPEKPTA